MQDPSAVLGMKFNPFAGAIDTRGYYHTESTKRIMVQILHGLRNRKGFVLLIGDVGVGKTSLLLQILPILQKEKITNAFVLNSMLSKEELLTTICKDFGLEPPPNSNLSSLLDILHKFFLKENSKGHNCVIIVDEAHNLEADVLESLRMLTNLETEGKKLVQIFLTGQSELWVRLNQPQLRQLRSRINIYQQLPPLNKNELEGYVSFKLARTGSQIRPTKWALNLLWVATRGNVRMVNLIMERALYALILRKKSNIDYLVIKEAIEDISPCQNELKLRVRINRLKKYALIMGSGLAVLLGILIANNHSQLLKTFSEDKVRTELASKNFSNKNKQASSKNGLKQKVQKKHSEKNITSKINSQATASPNHKQEQTKLQKNNTSAAKINKPKTPSNASQSSPAQKSTENYFIVQVGSYKERTEALAHVRALKIMGFDACFIKVWDKKGQKWFLVEIGLNMKKESAQKLADDFRQQTANPTKIINLDKSFVRNHLECPLNE